MQFNHFVGKEPSGLVVNQKISPSRLAQGKIIGFFFSGITEGSVFSATYDYFSRTSRTGEGVRFLFSVLAGAVAPLEHLMKTLRSYSALTLRALDLLFSSMEYFLATYFTKLKLVFLFHLARTMGILRHFFLFIFILRKVRSL